MIELSTLTYDVFDLEQVLNPDDSAVQQWVYNVHGSSTPMGYFIVWREKFGRWLAAPSAPTPHFSPLLTSTTVDEVTTWECGITWGWFHGPRARDDADTKEVPDWDRWPWMPEINEVRLDDATPEKLAFTNAATNITYLAVTLKERNVGIGDTLLPGFTGLQGVSGTTGYAPTGVTTENNTAPPDAHNHNVIEPETTIGTPPDDITVDGHYHDAQVDLQAVAYHIDPGVPPEFIVTTGNVPRNTELTRYIPWGKHVLDAAGIMTTAEWYWTGDRDFSVESWVRGAYSEGNIGSVTLGPTQPADDIGANPHPHGSVPSPWPTPPD